MPIKSLMQKKQWGYIWGERVIKPLVTNAALLYIEANKMDEEVWLATIENRALGKYFIAVP